MKIMRFVLSALFLLFITCSIHDDISSKTASGGDELSIRIEMAGKRMAFGKEPRITEEFLLAGVTLDSAYTRRFTNFSGDQCGRYLSAFSNHHVEGNPVDIHRLVKKIISAQKSDGRFGSDDLLFKTTKLSGEHMALLWGNGRLLNGLMDYYGAYQEEAVLNAAIRLGVFLSAVTQSCIQPDVIEVFKKKGAMGFICFTQNIEGLVKLFKATNNFEYIELAEKIYPLLPEMGTQHSHGYLNTLRGILMLYTITGKPEQLDFVITRYKTVLESDNYMISGGVPEFFGSIGSEDGYRDEGCSEADWLMLSLELWQTTGAIQYLDKAEYCLMNALMFNQFNSGDFGHHHIEPGFGYILSDFEGRAWWCCTYHGLQALLKARDAIVTNDNNVRKINLFYNTPYEDKAIGFSFNRMDLAQPVFRLTIAYAQAEEIAIGIRKPYWAQKMVVTLNKQLIETHEKGEYLVIRRTWKARDQIEINLDYALRMITRDRKTISLDQAEGKLHTAAIQYGPYLLSIDDGLMPYFMAEPSTGNVLIVNRESFQPAGKNSADMRLFNTRIADGYICLSYRHAGFYGKNQVILRPVSEVSHQRLANVRLWFNIERE